MNVFAPLIVLAFLAIPLPTAALTGHPGEQATAPARARHSRQIDAAQKRDAIRELAKLLRARYCVAEVAERAATFIENKIAGGGYDGLAEAQDFADAITVDLQTVTSDRHLRFGVAPPPEPAPAQPGPADAEAARAARLAAMRRNNFGLVKAEILPGNVGYLEVRRFEPPEVAGDSVVAALQFLVNSDAIILDLRNNHGGSAFAMPMFAGYFFERPTHLYDMVFRGDNYTDHYWTAAWLPGKRLASMPMYILTSAYTFSGAEALAYRFKVLKRATIVGETTGGGANAGGVEEVAPFFLVWMPMGRPVDRNTRTNWEGNGVEPDIKASARDALAVAHSAAIQAIRAKVTGEDEKARLDRALERVKARQQPVTISRQELEKLGGTYGQSRVWVEGGQLRFQRETESPYLLFPAARNVFFSDSNDPVRIEFVGQGEGWAKELVFTDEGGAVHRLARRE